ncbi:MAG: flagellar assembly protein FliW [Fibrobacterota bacterium]
MTDLFDNLVFKKEDILRFPEGIPGFESFTDFVLVNVPEHAPFQWLVCVSNRSLRFAVIDPMVVMPDYNPEVSKTQLQGLSLEKPEDVMLLVIITLRDNLLESTANFIGPLFINKKKMIGRQIVIDTEKYSVQERVIRS